MFTVFNQEEEKYVLVEEPDPSLTYTYADYRQWKFNERVELIKGRIFKMSSAPNLKHQQVSMRMTHEIFNYLKGTYQVKEYWVVYPVEESIAIFYLDSQGRYNGASIYAAGDTIESIAISGLATSVTDVFSTS